MNKFLLKELEAINTQLTYLIKYINIKAREERERHNSSPDYRNVDSNGNYVTDDDC